MGAAIVDEQLFRGVQNFAQFVAEEQNRDDLVNIAEYLPNTFVFAAAEANTNFIAKICL